MLGPTILFLAWPPALFLHSCAWPTIGVAVGCIHGYRTGYAPERNFIDVELEADETLTFAGTIWESDSPFELNLVYSGSDALPFDEIGVEGRTVEIEDRDITLTVRVEVLERP